jgi:outer membrane immunogenic protein
MTKAMDVTRVISGGAAVAAGIVGTAQAQDVAGFYGGLSLGLPNGELDLGFEQYSFTGNAGGLFAGYNFTQGDWVFGVEVAYTGDVGSESDSGVDYGLGLSQTIDLKGRVGRALGLTSSNVEWFGSESYGVSGTMIGAGFETSLGSNGFVGLDVTSRDLNKGLYSIYTENDRFTTTSIRAGFRF